MKPFVRVLATILVFSNLLTRVNAQGITALDKFLQDKSLSGASVGVDVTDAVTGEPIFQHNARILLAPASVAKLVISAAAIDLLGPEYRFRTYLAVNGSFDKVTGVLDGNLVIRGGGDPVTGTSWFNAGRQQVEFPAVWVHAVQEAGIKSVQGDIILDVSAFRQWDIPDTWPWEDLGNYYGAVPGAINLYDNTVRLIFESPATPGELVRLHSVVPEITGTSWINEVRSSPVNRDLAYVYGSPTGGLRLIRGTIPAGRSSFEVRASMPDPPLVFGQQLREQLLKSGIHLQGSVRKEFSPIQSDVIREISSPRLARICSVLNHESVNLIAESLVTQLAFNQNGFGNHEEGMKILNSYLREKTGEPALYLEDGSGLSRFTALSAGQISALLLKMHHHPEAQIFKSTLPVAGTATLRPFNVQKFPGNTLRCKSGSMTRVRAYAGYLTCNSGREVVFTIMANNFSGTQTEVFAAIEGFLSSVRDTY